MSNNLNAIAIPAAMLKAALICAANDPARPYINGVYVDPKGFLVSTDGHRLFCGTIDVSDVPAFDGYLIPRDVIKRALTGCKADLLGVSPNHVDDITYQAPGDSYPDWRRVVPTELNGATAQFNPVYVADMGKIGDALAGKGRNTLRAHIHHNGDGPAGVTFPGCEDAFAVLMPIRTQYQDTSDTWAIRTKTIG